MAKKKLTYMERRQKEEQVNKKAIIWVGAVALAIIVIMSVLLIINQ